MTSDEPGGWELKRALSDLRTDVRDGNKAIRDELAKLVSTEAHAADMRRIDDAIRGISEDLANERQARVEQIALERETRTIEINNEKRARKEDVAGLADAMQRTAVWVRWIAASVLIPTVLFLANLITQRGI